MTESFSMDFRGLINRMGQFYFASPNPDIETLLPRQLVSTFLFICLVVDRHRGLSLRQGVIPDMRMFLREIIVTTSPWLSGACPRSQSQGRVPVPARENPHPPQIPSFPRKRESTIRSSTVPGQAQWPVPTPGRYPGYANDSPGNNRRDNPSVVVRDRRRGLALQIDVKYLWYNFVDINRRPFMVKGDTQLFTSWRK